MVEVLRDVRGIAMLGPPSGVDGGGGFELTVEKTSDSKQSILAVDLVPSKRPDLDHAGRLGMIGQREAGGGLSRSQLHRDRGDLQRLRFAVDGEARERESGDCRCRRGDAEREPRP